MRRIAVIALRRIILPGKICVKKTMRLAQYVALLMERDGMSSAEAEGLVAQARADLYERLESDSDDYGAYDICEEWFGLEPDYIEELII